MLKDMETSEQTNQDEQSDIREKIEVTIRRLQELKERVAELKRRCEEFRRTASERTKQEHMPRCDRCGHAVDPDQQVAVKDSHGVERSHYHKECFQTLLK